MTRPRTTSPKEGHGSSARPRLRLLELFPSHTAAGAAFNQQPDGRAALAVRCRHATQHSTIVFRGTALPTVFDGSDILTAFIPSELYRQPGPIDVHLREHLLGESNRLTFRVLPDSASRPGVDDPQRDAATFTVTQEPRLLILILHFGSWPEWFPLFLETCRWNPTVDWLIVTDCDAPQAPPTNVRFAHESLEGITRHVAKRLGFSVPIEFPYKLCDLRLAFPLIFDHLTGDYHYVGWGDLDVVYGDIRRLLEREALENDVITFYEGHLAGHLTLVRNTAAARELHLQVPAWETLVRRREYQHLDEPSPELLRARFPVWAKQSYNTPLSPYVPWRDGTFNFPKEWYWQQGRLTNDLDGSIEFLYLHFMHWKGGQWPRTCGNAQWERLDRIVHFDPALAKHGFRITDRGFFPLNASPSNLHSVPSRLDFT